MGYYIAQKTMTLGPGRTYKPGDRVPEADSHSNPKPWVDRGFIKFVEDDAPSVVQARAESVVADPAPKKRGRPPKKT